MSKFRKILAGFSALALAVALMPMFAAFEAHVINVTAKIENALSVSTTAIDFGTVFPQEHLDKPLVVQLSQSFLDEERVDDVEYFIRQKPKCAITSDNGESFDAENTATGHISLGDNPATLNVVETDFPLINCGDAPRQLLEGENWGVLPSLCEYISKEGEDANDQTTLSFHQPWTVEQGSLVWLDTHGHLAKSEDDEIDNWIIDLAVPCFGNHCAQDWEEFVENINPSQDTPEEAAQWVQDPANEHKIFGCDLWVEVGGISLPGFGCEQKIDLMLVVDRSGSIGDTDMANVRTALHSFIDALVLSNDGPNAGQSSFATVGTLDQQLTGNEALVDAAIDALVSSGNTNLTEGINLAQAEFDSVRDRADAPNIMLVVTDGQPNEGGADPAAEAAAAATAAKADGTEIFVVGVGAGVDATYLQNSIASSPSASHYFAGDFITLQTTLVDLLSCENPEN